PAKAEPGDGRTVRTSQVVRRHLIGDTELRADRAHDRRELRGVVSIGKNSPVQQSLHWLRQPHAMALAVLGARPSFAWLARHFPPTVDDVLGAHMSDLARTLPGEQDELERNPG